MRADPSFVARASLSRRTTWPADVQRESVSIGDTFLLGTDGLSEVLEEEELAAWLGQAEVETACRRLVERAYELGGRDNITAVVLRATGP